MNKVFKEERRGVMGLSGGKVVHARLWLAPRLGKF